MSFFEYDSFIQQLLINCESRSLFIGWLTIQWRIPATGVANADGVYVIGGAEYGYQIRFFTSGSAAPAALSATGASAADHCALTVDAQRLSLDSLPPAVVNPVSPVFQFTSLDMATVRAAEITLWHYVTHPSAYSLMVVQQWAHRSGSVDGKQQQHEKYEAFSATKNRNGGSDNGSDYGSEEVAAAGDAAAAAAAVNFGLGDGYNFIYPANCIIRADTVTFTVTQLGTMWVEMPQKAFKVPRIDWQPDSARSKCNYCKTSFEERKLGLYSRRKHHCRYCGLVCCRYCCALRLDLERCCDLCMRNYQIFQRFRDNGGEACPISTVSMIVSCKIDWHAHNFMSSLTFSGYSKQQQHHKRSEIEYPLRVAHAGVEYLVPHQIDFHLPRLSNRELCRPQVRVSVKLRKADGTSYRLNSSRNHFIEGAEEVFALSECAAIEIECRAAGMRDALHKNHKVVWRTSRPLDAHPEGMDVVRDSSFMEFAHGKKAVLTTASEKQQHHDHLLRWQSSRSPFASRQLLQRTNSVLMYNEKIPDLIDGELANLRQALESSAGSPKVGLFRRRSTGAIGGGGGGGGATFSSGNRSDEVTPEVIDAVTQLEMLLANVGRRGLLNPLQTCSLLVAMAADADVNIRIKGRIVEVLNQVLITLFEREIAQYEVISGSSGPAALESAHKITAVPKNDRIKMCKQIDELEAAIHKREDAANPSVLFRLKWATVVAKGGLGIMRDFETLEENMRHCFALLSRKEAQSQTQLLDLIDNVLKKHGHNASSACFAYSAVVIELSPSIFLPDSTAFQRFQALINASMTQFGFYWPRTYSVLEAVCRFIRSIKVNDDEERQQQLHTLFFGEEDRSKGLVDFVVFRSPSRANCWRIREAAVRMLYECTTHFSDEIRRASVDWIMRRRRDESRPDRVFKFVDEINGRCAVTNIKIA